jgi:ribosomal protein S12 methylthiotransferase accessory factor
MTGYPAACRLAAMLPSLVDDHVGVLRAVKEIRRQPGAPRFFHFAAHLSNTLAFSEYPNSGSRGAAAADRETSVTRVILDAVAGYCAALISEDDGKHPVCSAERAAFRCAPPEDFALFSPEQYAEPGFPYTPFRDSTPVQWSEAVDPLDEESIFIPSCLRFLPYSAMVGHGERLIAPASSTGLACHWDAATAAAEAVCDVVECDTLAIVWQARMSLPQIRVETLSDANYDLVSRFEHTGASITLLKAVLDLGITTVIASLSRSGRQAPARIFAAATALDPEQTVRRSLEMLAHVEQYSRLLWREMPRVSSDPGKIVDQSDHLNYWCDHGHAAGGGFLFASKQRIEFDEIESLSAGQPSRDLRKLLDRIRGAGYRTLLANLTTPDIGGLGLTAVRAVMPGLHPLFFGFRTRALGGTRLWTVPRRLGRGEITPPCGDNPHPHPFPRKGKAS